MQLPTIKIREKATGRVKIINQTKYGDNLAGYTGWEIISMRRGDAPDSFVELERNQERIEVKRAHNPKSPAYLDPQRAFEARSAGATINTNAPAQEESPFATELTSAISVTTKEPDEDEVREIPVIGGAQTVRVRGRKSVKSPSHDEGEVI